MGFVEAGEKVEDISGINIGLENSLKARTAFNPHVTSILGVLPWWLACSALGLQRTVRAAVLSTFITTLLRCYFQRKAMFSSPLGRKKLCLDQFCSQAHVTLMISEPVFRFQWNPLGPTVTPGPVDPIRHTSTSARCQTGASLPLRPRRSPCCMPRQRHYL